MSDDSPPDCPLCHGQTEWSGGRGIVCFFCGYERLLTTTSSYPLDKYPCLGYNNR